jgi:hypothetical protein
LQVNHLAYAGTGCRLINGNSAYSIKLPTSHAAPHWVTPIRLRNGFAGGLMPDLTTMGAVFPEKIKEKDLCVSVHTFRIIVYGN